MALGISSALLYASVEVAQYIELPRAWAEQREGGTVGQRVARNKGCAAGMVGSVEIHFGGDEIWGESRAHRSILE